MIAKLIRRNVAGKPFRFLLTCLAVTVGVMFTVGVFVFTDGMREQFAELAENIEGDTDFAVRTAIDFGGDIDRPPFDPQAADIVASIEGTTDVQPFVIDFNTRVLDENGPDGSLVGGGFANIGLSWPDPRLFLQEGRDPSGPNEFVINAKGAEDSGLVIGERYRIQGPSATRDDFVLVGTFFFASEFENLLLGGASQAAFDNETAIEFLNAGAGVDRVEFSVESGADEAAVVAEVEAALNAELGNLEVVDGEQLQAEQEDDFNEVVSIFRTILLAFAIIILAVSAFVIYNVFTILIGQRVRELGLMRAIGATGTQVTQALLGEAFIVGIVSTAFGIVFGIGLGWLQGWALGRLEFGPGADSLVITPWAILWGVVVGVAVTMASATAPALRARHLSPMAALRDDIQISRVVPTRNVLIGVPIVIAAWAVLAIGLSIGDSSSWPVWIIVPAFGFFAAFANAFGLRRLHAAVGRYAMLIFGGITIVLSVVLDLNVGELLLLLAVAAVCLFLGVNAISPLLARPVSDRIGRWPLAILLTIGGAILLVGAGLGAVAALLGGLIGIVVSVATGEFGDIGLFVGIVVGGVVLAVIAIYGWLVFDASLILGWRFGQVLGAIGVFLVGAAGAISLAAGVFAVLGADWAGAATIVVGGVILGVAVWLRRFLPAAMKANARMARENAGRSPQRTASAAAALMIGVALISTATVVTESFKATFADVLAERVISDFFIGLENQFDPSASFSRELAESLNELPEVESTISFRFNFEAFQLSTDGSTRDSTAVELATSFEHFDPGFVEVDRSLVGPDSLWVHEDVAEDAGLELGDALAITFNDGSVEPVRVSAIYEDLTIFGSAAVDLELWERHFPTSQDAFVSVILAEGVDEEAARIPIEEQAEAYPVIVDTREEFQERQEGSIDQFLFVFTILLFAAIGVALLGIAITLALSVFERTRELGLVRAVGMTRRQMMRMVLFEGSIIAAFGGILGVVLGAIFGSAAVTVIPNTFISQLAIPVDLLVQYLVLASLAGIGAGIIPAIRAARLNVLEAISQE